MPKGGENLKLTEFHCIQHVLLGAGNDIYDLNAGGHETIPVGRRSFKVRHNFRSFRSQFHVTILAPLDEIPQRIRNADG